MSADTATQAEISRVTRAILKGAGARLAGKKRGPDRCVRRNSLDVGDHRARVWVRINGGGRRAGLRWCDTLKRIAREYDLVGKADGKQGPISLTGGSCSRRFSSLSTSAPAASNRPMPS